MKNKTAKHRSSFRNRRTEAPAMVHPDTVRRAVRFRHIRKKGRRKEPGIREASAVLAIFLLPAAAVIVKQTPAFGAGMLAVLSGAAAACMALVNIRKGEGPAAYMFPAVFLGAAWAWAAVCAAGLQ